MPQSALPVILLALAVPAAAPGALDTDAPAREHGIELAQLTIQQHIVIRVPMAPPPPAPVVQTAPTRYKEKKGPRCIPAQGMAGALISAPNQVDLVLIGGKRIRARLDGDCKPLDFYSGFYLRPSGDGMICADRDSIRVRSGASCGIERFRLLQAVK